MIEVGQIQAGAQGAPYLTDPRTHTGEAAVGEHTSVQDGAARAAARLLDGEPDLTVFSTWAIGWLRGVQRQDLRYASLDGILQALDAHEVAATS